MLHRNASLNLFPKHSNYSANLHMLMWGFNYLAFSRMAKKLVWKCHSQPEEMSMLFVTSTAVKYKWPNSGMKLAAILCKKSWDTVLIKEDFSVSDISVFFYPSSHFNVVAAAKSIGQSNIVNIEKGEGGFDGIQCNFIENEGKSIDYRKKLWVSQPFCMGLCKNWELQQDKNPV